MQALYRKYRSRSLAEVVGQEHITDTLTAAIKNGRISHAYLFTGPRGVGKTSVARILAYEINKLPYTDEPQLDIIEIDAASNRRIDDIRDLRDKVHIAPVSAEYKIYIIDEVHMLTGESFNALLKTLEEPPSHVIFILATTEAHKLPATIISRTQRYNFRPVVLDKVIAHLRSIAKQEKIAINDEAMALIADYGDGSFRDSISLLDQLANATDGTITAATVEQTLGLAPHQALETLIAAVEQKDYQQITTQLSALWQQGATVSALLPQLLRALQQTAQTQPELYTLLDRLIEVPRAFNPQIKLLTLLIDYALTHGNPAQQTVAAKQAPTVAQPAKPLLDISIPPRPQPATKPEPAPVTIEQPTEQAALDSLSLDQWAQVLGKIKEISTPLQSVFRQAEPVFDAEKQTLTLRFKYQLHRKRADDTKAKNALTKALLATLGSIPAIVTELSADTVTPEIASTPTAATLDETAQSVAALMGGGEPV